MKVHLKQIGMGITKKEITIFMALSFMLVCETSDAQEKVNWTEDLTYAKSYLEIMHPRLFDFVSEEEFNQEFDYLFKNWQHMDDAEMITSITEIFAKIHDGHTGVSYFAGDEHIKEILHYYPVWLYKFSDGYFVLYAKNEYRELVGKKITKLGNLEISDAIKQIMRLQAGDNHWGKTQYIPLIQEFLQYTGVTDMETGELLIQYENENGKREVVKIEKPESLNDFYFASKVFPQKDQVVIAMNDGCAKPLPLYLSHLNEGGYSGNDYWYTWLPEQETIYLQISNNKDKPDDPFGAFCKRMFHDLDSLKAKKLIVDVRLNGGGNHFEMPLIKGIIARPNIDSEGNLFLITSRRTISASEHLTTQMETYTHVLIFGEPTAARPNMVGSITRFTLPNSGLKCFTAKEYTQDSEYRDFRLTTKPHVYSLSSSCDFKNNYDPVLPAIFNYDSIKQVKEACNNAMQQGYKSNGIPGLQKAFYKHKPECLKAGINTERFLIDEFSWWIYPNRKQKEDYAAYIKFVVDEMPESMLANYWYGRNCQLNNKPNLAKEYYKRCLEINPAHLNAIKYSKLIDLNEKYHLKNYGL